MVYIRKKKMKLSIIVEDGAVYKDKISFAGIDLSDIPNNVCALQFNDTTNTGHIEYYDQANEDITVLPNWAISASNKHSEALAAWETQQELAKQALAEFRSKKNNA
jgi:hypothetical protein